MNRHFLAIPIAAALTLSFSACGRDEDPMSATNPELPRAQDAPVNKDRPAAEALMNPDTSDPSIPQNPASTDPAKKDSSPPAGTGAPKVDKPEG
jgi:hypothetical protein